MRYNGRHYKDITAYFTAGYTLENNGNFDLNLLQLCGSGRLANVKH